MQWWSATVERDLGFGTNAHSSPVRSASRYGSRVRSPTGRLDPRVCARTASRRAFSLLELLNSLSLLAVLSSLAMYGVSRYLIAQKGGEAVGVVGTIAKSAAAYYNDSDATQPAGGGQTATHAMRHFPPSSRSSVPPDADAVRGKGYQSGPADWSPSPWRELNFSIHQPQYYRYSFESSGAGRGSVARVIAEGDLDGDGIRSTYIQRITVNDKLEAEVDPRVERQSPEE